MYKDAVYSSGFLAIEQQYSLNQQRMDRMLASDSLLSALNVLLECGYNKKILSKHPVDIDLLLDYELKKTVGFFTEYCTDENLLKACLKKYDYHNAKTALKAKFSTLVTDTAFYGLGTISKDLIIESIENDDFDALPSAMAEALYKLGEQEIINGKSIDIFIDRALSEDIQAFVKKIKSRNIRNYFAIKADACNILTAARLKKYSVPPAEALTQFIRGGNIPSESLLILLTGKNTEIIAEFINTIYLDAVEKLATTESDSGLKECEQALHDLLLESLKAGVLNVFSDEPLFAWYEEKLEELKTVRLIAIAKKNNFGVETALKRKNRLD